MMAASKVGGEISRTKKLIKSALIGAGLTSIDGSVLSKCVALASTLGLSPETMAEVWEAYSLNKQNLTELTMHQFEAYKNELIKASSTVPIPPVTTSTSSNANTDSPRGAIGISRKDTAAFSSAKRGAQTAPMVTPTSSSKRPKHEFEQEHEHEHQQRQGSLFGDLGSGSAVDTAASDAVPSPLRSNARGGTVQQQQQQQQQQQKRQTQRPKPNLPKYDERTNAGQVVACYPSDRSKFQAEASFEGTERSRCVLTTTSTATKKSASASASASTSTSNGTMNETADVTIYNVTKPYRHMFTTMEDRALALEKHLVRIREAIESDIASDKTGNKEKDKDKEKEKEKREHAPLEEVNVPRQDPSTFVGRICNEAHTGRLNATSVVLEGSSASCGGARVNVDLSKIQPEQNPKGYSLFPGQIVALEGMNGTGRKITVSKLREGTSLPPASSSVRSLRNYYKTTGRKAAPLKIVSACGPFTTSDSNEYAPFIDLMGVVIDEQPDLVILKGPFVDVRQEAVKSGAPTVPGPDGEMDRPMVVDHETIFAQNISLVIEEFFEQQQGSNSSSNNNNKTQFVLVPALEDATGKGVYPQPPLQDRFSDGASRFLDIPGAESIAFGSSGLYELTNAKASPDGLQRVHCLSNPCTFRVNELVVGVTSTDVLFHTSVEETHAHLPVGSRMRRMAQHLVSQQSYYPLFPPHKSVNLDLKQQDQFRMPCRPDILLVPSRLAPFCAPILGTTMAINPGHLSKGTTGGTYAILTIRPMDEKKLGGNETNSSSNNNDNDDDDDDDDDDSVLLTHDAPERMQVEIKRI